MMSKTVAHVFGLYTRRQRDIDHSIIMKKGGLKLRLATRVFSLRITKIVSYLYSIISPPKNMSRYLSPSAPVTMAMGGCTRIKYLSIIDTPPSSEKATT